MQSGLLTQQCVYDQNLAYWRTFDATFAVKSVEVIFGFSSMLDLHAGFWNLFLENLEVEIATAGLSESSSKIYFWSSALLDPTCKPKSSTRSVRRWLLSCSPLTAEHRLVPSEGGRRVDVDETCSAWGLTNLMRKSYKPTQQLCRTLLCHV